MPARCMMLSRSFRSTATLCATKLRASNPVEASSPGFAALNLTVGNSCEDTTIYLDLEMLWQHNVAYSMCYDLAPVLNGHVNHHLLLTETCGM